MSRDDALIWGALGLAVALYAFLLGWLIFPDLVTLASADEFDPSMIDVVANPFLPPAITAAR